MERKVKQLLLEPIQKTCTPFIAIELCLQGFHGSARMILRQVLEFLIIAKYASVTHDKKFIKHWEKGGDIGIGKQIFQKLQIQDKKSLTDLWELLCGFNHATSYSQQIGIRYKEVKQNTLGDLAVIIILLNCNLHLLTQHVLDTRMKYYSSSYFDIDKKEMHLKANKISKISRAYLAKEGLAAVKTYKSAWSIL